MVKSLSDNSFIIYENMAGERTLCLKVTIDDIYKYEVFCGNDDITGKLYIGNEEHILDYKDPISNIVLQEVIYSGLAMCRDSPIISIWQKNNLMQKYNQNWRGKITRVFDNPIMIMSFVLMILLMLFSEKIYAISLALVFIFTLIYAIKEEVALSRDLNKFTSETENYNKDCEAFIKAQPEINRMLEKSIDLLIQQIDKKRNNKVALN